MRPDFTRAEALAALYYCRRNVRVQELYLREDRKRNPQSDHAYSLWKLKEARDDLRAAEERIKVYGLSWLNPDFYSKNRRA